MKPAELSRYSKTSLQFVRLVVLLSLLVDEVPVGAQSLSKKGPEFRVNTYTTGFQSSPKVAVGTRGQFIVTWGSDGSYGSDLGASIQAQQFNEDGSRRGSEFQVNSYTTSFQFWPAVALNGINDFVVVWASIGSFGTDTDVFSIQGQRLDAEARLIGPEFQVNTFTTRRQYYPAVAADAAGNFIIVWESLGSFGSDQFAASVQGQRFAAEGSRLGGEFQINAYTTGAQRGPAVAMSETGEFMVVWASNAKRNNENQGYVVQGQSFAADGSRIGAEFQVNRNTTHSNRWPVVAAEASGDFVVAWSRYDYNSVVPRGDIFVRRVSRNGTMITDEFQTSTVQEGFKSVPSIAAQPDGFVVVWRVEYESGPYDIEVKGQRVGQSVSGSNLFADGFESGNLSTWSSAVP